MPAKLFRAYSPTQSFLLPPSPMDWLPEEHLVYFVLDVVADLDLSGITSELRCKDPRGERPYSPSMMVALLLYGYCEGVFSSRRLERATQESVPFRVLTGGEHPHFTTINNFRRRHEDALRDLFGQVLRLCQRAGMVKLGHVALDGTKVKGNASKHNAMSYERMVEQEERLKREIDSLLSRAAEADALDDARFGEGERQEDLPEELRRREDRLARLQQAKAEVEEEAKAARARALREQASRAEQRSQAHPDPVERKRAGTVARKKRAEACALESTDDEDDSGGHNDDDDDAPTSPQSSAGLPLHAPRTKPDGTPHPKAQRSFTDPDSRLMESGGAFVQGYNCQAAVDEERQIIVAHGVTNQCPDNGNLAPMLEQVRDNCGAAAKTATADAGYWTPPAQKQCDALGTDVYVSTGRKTRPPSSNNPRKRMHDKLQTPEGAAIYSRRKAVVEPVFGQIKESRGFRRFLVRGLFGVETQWSLICTTHNLLKLFRYGRLCPA